MTSLRPKLQRFMPRVAMLLAVICAFQPLLQQLWAWSSRGEMLYALLYDDAYYYARMAISWVDGHGYSFNGLEQTNGFQPLWMLVVTGLAYLAGGAIKPFFVLYIAAISLINALSIWWFARLFRSRLGELAAWLVPLFLMVILPQVFSWGMETVLAVPALYFLVHRLSTHGWLQRHYREMGWALVWLFLVRLDSLVLLPLLLLWAIWRERASLHALLALTLPVVVTVFIYAVANLIWFDSPVPVSGLAKSLGSPRFANFTVYAYLSFLFLHVKTALFFVLWLVAELAWRKRSDAGHAHQVILFFVLVMLAQFGYYATLSGWGVWPWYGYCFVAVLTALILRIHELTDSSPASPAHGVHRAARALMLVIMSVVIARHVVVSLGGPMPVQTFADRNYRDASAGIFADKTVIMGDRAGSLGFWEPQVRIVQTEGLVMSKAFIKAKHEGRGAAWIDQHYRIDELVVDRPWLPTLGQGEKRVYLVVEPIQAMLWQELPLIYCFPQQAVLSEEKGNGFLRYRFDYAKRIRCPQALTRWLDDANQRGQLFSLSFALRREGLSQRLHELDIWLARKSQQAPQSISRTGSQP